MNTDKLTNPIIKKAIVFSVPMDLHTSCLKISRPGNWVYARRFLASLRKKVKQKAQRRKEIGIQGIDRINTLLEFDDRYTAPIHGFRAMPGGGLHRYRSRDARALKVARGRAPEVMPDIPGHPAPGTRGPRPSETRSVARPRPRRVSPAAAWPSLW